MVCTVSKPPAAANSLAAKDRLPAVRGSRVDTRTPVKPPKDRAIIVSYLVLVEIAS
jgi:hypothetical protein